LVGLVSFYGAKDVGLVWWGGGGGREEVGVSRG
jgi:hypothetical protein